MDYDPLLSKLIGYGGDRNEAIAKLQRALGEYFVGGIKTNISLFQEILCDPDFQTAKLDTAYLERLLGGEADGRTPSARATSRDQVQGRFQEQADDAAAIAAGIFAMLDPVRGGASKAAPNCANSAAGAQPSSWRQTALREGLH